MAAFVLASCVWLPAAGVASAQQALIGQPVVEVVVEQEGKPLVDPLVNGLIETRVGQPLSMREVRESIDHLYNLRRFEDIQPTAETVPGGVRLRYVVVPTHPVDLVEFEGALGIDEGTLRRIVTDQFGRTPAASRAPDVAAALRQAYRDRGYPSAVVTPRVVETHDPDRATLLLEVAAGQRAIVREVRIDSRIPEEQSQLIDVPQIPVGQPYDRQEIDDELARWAERMREQGYYEARASHGATIPGEDAIVFVTLTRGPRVVLEFTGDPLPDREQERLVPIRTEGSADQDLLEDAQRNIQDYLHARGYRDATAPYTRRESLGELIITFNVTQGPRYVVEAVTATGNSALPSMELQQLIGIARGDLFVQSTLESRAQNIENTYRARGFTKAVVTPVAAVIPSEGPSGRDRRVEIRLAIVEGPRTTIRSVTFDGEMALTESQLRAIVSTMAGGPFSEVAVIESRDAIDLEYQNRGYEAVDVTATTALSDDGTQADVRFGIAEGPQSLVDHIIVVGNDRTSTETITRALRIYEGGPLGYSDLVASRGQLWALGLFRRVEIQALPHQGEPRRDVLVVVEEADPTLLDFGGGVEGGFRGRQSENGQIVERFDVAPRGSFTIGRRNLWGKNRTVSLFTRVSLRSSDVVIADQGVALERRAGSEAFNEYRVVASLNEPRAFSTDADVLFTAVQEQGLRTSFNFARRIARVEAFAEVSPVYRVSGRYSFETTKLFDERLDPDRDPDLPSIDRLFPEVRLSRFAGSIIRNTTDDLLDPSRGSLVTIDGDLAMRAIGSEIGFMKTFVQAFGYRQLPTPRRAVLALGARVGVARGFERDVNGQRVADLPASERFFAGGATTVRGFSLDRLGNAATINPETGFPSGGNSVVVVNSELRVNVVGDWQGVGFFDAGNVFLKASDLDLTDLRPSAGFGLRYDFPGLGPIRVDFGFNLDRRELVPGRPEKRMQYHISFGQAF